MCGNSVTPDAKGRARYTDTVFWRRSPDEEGRTKMCGESGNRRPEPRRRPPANDPWRGEFRRLVTRFARRMLRVPQT